MRSRRLAPPLVLLALAFSLVFALSSFVLVRLSSHHLRQTLEQTDAPFENVSLYQLAQALRIDHEDLRNLLSISPIINSNVA